MALNSKRQIGAIGYRDHVAVWKANDKDCQMSKVAEKHTFILVLDEHVVGRIQLPFEDTLHHKQKLVVRDVFVLDGNFSNIFPQCRFDDDFVRQIQADCVLTVTGHSHFPETNLHYGLIIKITGKVYLFMISIFDFH